MKLRLSILLLAAALAASPAAGQTIKSLGYNTTNGQIVYSGTNPLTFTNPLNLTNTVRVGVFGQGSSTGFAGRSSGGNLALYGTNVTSAQPAFYGFDGFANTAFSAGVARTNLELGASNAVTFGNVILNNDGNIAPAQTAASASSLMTRGLTDNNPLFALGSVRSMGAFAFGNSGAPASAVTSISAGGAFLTTGTATNAFARASLYTGINDAPSFTGAGIRFTQNISVAGIFTLIPRTNVVYRLIVGGNAGTPASGSSNALTTRGFGVEIDSVPPNTRMRLFAHDGTNYTNSVYTGTLTNSASFQNHIIVSGRTNGEISLFLSVSPVNKAPARPSTTPLLTLSGGPTSGNGLGFVDFVAVTLLDSAAAPAAGQALFFNGMLEVKD